MKQLVTHPTNSDLAQEIVDLAHTQDLVYVHNASAARTGQWDGYHRYLLLREGATNLSIRSKSRVAYWETRYARYGRPSIRGERACLAAMLNYLRKRFE